MKRPIDHQRDAAVRFELGTKEDGEIRTMFPIGGVLHVIKDKSIYAIRLADNIDPVRTNRSIPNTQQRILNHGAESELVGRILLTAKRLFEKDFLPSDFDSDRALVLALDVLTSSIAMTEIAAAIRLAEQEAADFFNKHEGGRGALTLPAIGDVESRCKTFIQKADHACGALLGIATVFYKRPWPNGFSGVLEFFETKYGSDDPLTKFAAIVAPFMRQIRETRNAIEHPKPDQRCVITDFFIRADSKIVTPTIEVHYRARTYPGEAVSNFMARITSELPEIFEAMIAYLCTKHVGSFAVPIQVAEIPEEERVNNKHVRLSYVGIINGKSIPFVR
jgi:hypothetical protein